MNLDCCTGSCETKTFVPPNPPEIRYPPPPTSVIGTSDDDCTMTNGVQVGENFNVTVSAFLTEGTTINFRVGVRLDPNGNTVFVGATVTARGCSFSHTSASAGTTSLQVIGGATYALMSFGDVVNPYDQPCSRNLLGSSAYDNSDRVIVDITLRAQYNTAADLWKNLDIMQLAPVIIYDVYNPRSAVSVCLFVVLCCVCLFVFFLNI